MIATIVMPMHKYLHILRLLLARESEDEAERHIERYRRIFKSISGTLLSQVVTVLTALVTTPLMLGYLGAERYGLITTLTTALIVMNYLDFGIGIGVQNRVSTAYGVKEYATAQKYVSTGYAFFAILLTLLVLFAIFGLPMLPLAKLLRIQTTLARQELLPTFQVIFCAVAVGLLSSYIQRLCDGLQQSYLTRYISIASRILGFVLVIVLVYLKVSLPLLVLGTVLPNLSNIFAYAVLVKKYPWMTPRFTAIRGEYLRDVMRIGIHGLTAVIAITIMTNGLPFLIGNRIGVAETASYNVTNRLFVMIITIVNAITMPFWPAFTEAKASGNMAWIRSAFARCLKVALVVAVPPLLALLFFGRQLIYLWTHNHQVVPSLSLLLFFVVSTLLLTLNAVMSALLNGFDRFTGQGMYGLLTAGLSVACAYLVNLRYGPEGICWVFAIGLLLRCLCMFVEIHLLTTSHMREEPVCETV